ncbi:hypothetical protein ACIQC9_12370 [Brevundimonas sp. NPDC092305]|uniref:hypothetical protein n=1 Tax=Brevundimonas sp. NPDC092305 TaxID=3363957 RepID=UPI0037F542F0
MKTVVAALCLAMAAIASPAAADWEGARWGMSVDEAHAAIPGLRPVRHGIRLSDARKHSVRDVVFMGIEAEASYFYDETGLAFVRLDVPFRQCQALVEGLLTRYGPPLEVDDQLLLKLITWDDAAEGNRLVLMHSAAEICNLRITSLPSGEPGTEPST